MFDHVDIISVQFLAGIWLLAAVAVVVAFRTATRSATRKRPIRVTSFGLAALLAITLASADTVNAHYAYLPTAGDVRASLAGDRQWIDVSHLSRLTPPRLRHVAQSGAVVRIVMPADRANGFAHSISIAYLPKQYFTDPTARFPVVYLFHGSPGRPADWFHAGGADSEGIRLAAAGHPTILVAPQLSQSWTDDPECVDGAKEKVETHVMRVVIPTIDATFRTIPDRQARVFAGMSAGGYCALNLGLRNRAVVATIVDMSGYTVPTHSGGMTHLFGRVHTAELTAANSPKVYVARLPNSGPPLRIWLDSGTDDKTVIRQMAELVPLLQRKGVVVKWQVRSGGHTYWVWRAAVEEALPWAVAGRPGKPAHDPSRPGPAGPV